MERFDGEEIEEPVSPTGQYLTSSSLSVYILGVLETEVPIDDSQTVPLLQNLFLPINSRFSSIMSINDVLAGVIFFGIRLYMQEINLKSSQTQSTALVLLNTRNIEGYKSVKEMINKTNSRSSWGNQYAFLHVPIPELSDSKYANPLEFIREAHMDMTKKKNSLATPLTGMLLDMLRKLRGPEAAARYLRNTLRNSSTTISNIIGPVEQMAVANHPIKGFYFMVAGSPESLTMTIMSYMGKIRIAFGVEKNFIDKQLFKSCLENSLEMIKEAAKKIST